MSRPICCFPIVCDRCSEVVGYAVNTITNIILCTDCTTSLAAKAWSEE